MSVVPCAMVLTPTPGPSPTMHVTGLVVVPRSHCKNGQRGFTTATKADPATDTRSVVTRACNSVLDKNCV